jgi:DNA-binding transcriptional ArsR family regulator
MNSLQDPLSLQAEVFNTLAHPSRLEILELLRAGEACVCHIQAMLEQRQSYISQHLNVLRHAGLVTSRKDGLRVYYQVSDPQVFTVIDAMVITLRNLGKIPPLTGDVVGAAAVAVSKSCNCPQCAARADDPVPCAQDSTPV